MIVYTDQLNLHRISKKETTMFWPLWVTIPAWIVSLFMTWVFWSTPPAKRTLKVRQCLVAFVLALILSSGQLLAWFMHNNKNVVNWVAVLTFLVAIRMFPLFFTARTETESNESGAGKDTT
jgi:hypothetical protein